MIVVQLILLITLLGLLIKFLADPISAKISAWKKILGAIFTLLAVAAVISPNSANRVAHAVGVGRGADLLVYLLTLGFLFLCLNLYLRAQYDRKRLVELARNVALLEARQREHELKSGRGK